MFELDIPNFLGEINRTFYDDKKKIVSFVSVKENILCYKFKDKNDYLKLKQFLFENFGKEGEK